MSNNKNVNIHNVKNLKKKNRKSKKRNNTVNKKLKVDKRTTWVIEQVFSEKEKGFVNKDFETLFTLHTYFIYIYILFSLTDEQNIYRIDYHI